MPLSFFSYFTASLISAAVWWTISRAGRPPARDPRVQVALAASVVWAAGVAALMAGDHITWARSPLIEFARYLPWLLASPALIGVPLRTWFGRVNLALVAIALLLLAVNATVSCLVLAFTGLVNVEQLLRNAPPALLRPVKLCVVALGGLFAYDLFMYSHLVLLPAPSESVWVMRGFVVALLMPVMAVGVRDLSARRTALFVSRQVVFYTTAFVAVGAYLLATAVAGYGVQVYGGAWSEGLRVMFFIGAGLVLALLLVTDSPWRRLRVFLSKHFYRAKYDYRREWLRFVATLEGREGEDARITSVRAVAQMVESPGGVLYLRDEGQGPCYAAGSWMSAGAATPPTASIGAEHELVRFLADREWVVDLREYRRSPEVYQNIAMPEWLLQEEADWRIVSPLFERDRLLGFLALQAPPEPFNMNFEDRDLLRMAGRHVATLLVQQAAERRLTESRQFDAFNRFAAFVMHDLKNSVAQLQLLVSNAARHRNNPEFVNDAFGTIENTVSRMTRLIEHLHSRDLPATEQVLDPVTVVREAVARAGARAPVPVVAEMPADLAVRADPERLCTVLDHVIRNAQDAAGASGSVDVTVVHEDRQATVTIRDTGPGMDPAFVRERLFRPFDSTKGARGMGIGAYQAREYIRRIGGDVEVQSNPGAGTRFIIRLPLCPQSQNAY